MKRHLRALDGLLLASVHYQNGDIESAGKAFVAAMAEQDIDTTIRTLERNLSAAFAETPIGKELTANAILASKRLTASDTDLESEADLAADDADPEIPESEADVEAEDDDTEINSSVQSEAPKSFAKILAGLSAK